MMDPLPLLWAAIIGFCIAMYVILDGFTLGPALLMPWLTKQERNLLLVILLTVVWLVLGGASLYGAFPIAFATILPIFYVPIITMIIALLLRGVVFEFRLKTKDPKYWDMVFIGASLLVIICQGYMLGHFIEGFSAHKHAMSWFIIVCMLGLIVGYALLGSTRLILKTIGTLAKKMFTMSSYLSWLVVFILAVVSLLTPFVDPHAYQRWFADGNWVYLFILPYLSALAFIGLQVSLYRKIDYLPFFLTIIIFICGFVGFCISIFPYLVPYRLTIWQCASPSSTLKFLLVGAVIMIPVLLVYTGYAYYVFKEKVTDVISY